VLGLVDADEDDDAECVGEGHDRLQSLVTVTEFVLVLDAPAFQVVRRDELLDAA
jgi:hypothetical protein